MQELLERFAAAHTQVLGVSVDSIHSHANWGRDLGGISFPLLADFEPKGEVARAYGHYLDEPGISDRATVILDSDGVIRHSSSVSPAGKRDIGELAALCEGIDTASDASGRAVPSAHDLPSDAVLYVKNHCGFSKATLLARDNLRLTSLTVKNASEDDTALEELRTLTGRETAPCLALAGEHVLESPAIVRRLSEMAAPLH